ncbi:MAG: serine hydrolase domain-containing protein [Pseudomonadota bacterium]
MIEGYCATELQPVRETFAQGFTSGREVGAALAVWQDGRYLVNLWGGHRDRRRQIPWQEDTLACCFSVSKALTATCVLQALEQAQGGLDQALVQSVADVWPAFADAPSDPQQRAQKRQVTVRHLLAHQAGLPAFRQPVEKTLLYDWAQTCAALEQSSLWWVPGSAHGYHARTFGFLLGEVLRLHSGRTPGRWLREQIAEPLSAPVYLTLADELQVRCADMLPARVRLGEEKNWTPEMQQMLADFKDTSTVTGATFNNPSMGPGYMNQAAFRGAEMPALSGHATAAGLACLFGALPQLLTPATLAQATATQSLGPDQVLKSTTHFGLGYMLHHTQAPLGWTGCFGHAGAGGSMAFCDPQRDLGFAFVMNQMQEGVVTGGTTASACAAALQACLN